MFGAEQELIRLADKIVEHETRIRDLERTSDRQAGQLDSLNRYIEAKVLLEISRAVEKLKKEQ
jgi:hypothetical protein